MVAVSNYEASNAFYCDVLGAELIDLSYGRVGYRLPGGAQLNVHGPGNTASPRALDPVRPGNSDICLRWDGTVAEAQAHLAAHGVEVIEGPTERIGAGGVGTSVYFRDPDGSLLEFIVYG
ncbi:MAG TPA: VOC family protein [Gaiellaceae bacterium]|nr:VOC family protein [Gaiellaceae bacterium]